MRSILLGTCILGAVLLAPSVASAQAKQGDKEIAVGGNFFATSSGDTTLTSGNFFFGFGYYLTDRFEVKLSPTINISTTSIPGSPGSPAIKVGNTVIVPAVAATSGSTEVNVDGGLGADVIYLFGAQSSKAKFFVGGGIQIQSFKTDNGSSFSDNTFGGVQFGDKVYISDRTSLDLVLADRFNFSHPADVNLISFTVQLSYLF